MRAEALESLPVKHLPVVRMGYAYEQLCALLQRPSVKVHGAVLRHNPMRIRAWCDYAGAGVQFGYYLVLSLERAGCEGSD